MLSLKKIGIGLGVVACLATSSFAFENEDNRYNLYRYIKTGELLLGFELCQLGINPNDKSSCILVQEDRDNYF